MILPDAPFSTLFGMPVKWSEQAVQLKTVQVKPHKHRHSQSAAYHKRVEKKWRKRYGTYTVTTPCAYVLDNSVFGGIGNTLVLHPSMRASVEPVQRLALR